MISQLEPNARLFLSNLNRIGERMSRAQKQITTGVRVASVSDEPDQIAILLTARQHLEAAKQIETNLGRVKAEVDGAEQTLQTASQLFERVRTLGAQGANASQNAQSRLALANEVGAIEEQLTGLTGTVVEGRFIFSGDSDQTTPYTIDLTLATPLSLFQGTAATRKVLHPDGNTFAVAHTAQQIFDSTDPTTNVLKTIETLRQALIGNNPDTIRTAVEGLTQASVHLQSELSFYGTTQNRIAQAQEFGQQLQLQLKNQISSLEDVDLTDAILQLQQGQTQQQAALSSWAKIPRSTLFDFLG